jgi:hypothetical protein
VVASILSSSTDERFRRDPRDFSRSGPLTPELVTTLLLYMIADGNRRGYQHLLPAFWDEARSHGLELPVQEPVSAASFCEARHKIEPELVRHMLQRVAATLPERTSNSTLWHGRRVFAVDGTKINLQRSPDLEAAFGIPDGGYCPQVLLSTLLDVCARLPVDAVVSPYASCERQDLLRLLPGLERGNVLVLDRGYPSHEVLQALVRNGIDFLIRVPSSSTFSAIDDLSRSKGDDYLYYIDPPEGSPPEWERLVVRAVRLRGPDGKASFFLTSLRRTEFSRAQLRELYHMRWEAEEFYKLMKGPYIGQGQFRSRTPSGIRQEVHALVLFLAIARLLMATAAEAAGVAYDEVSQKSAVLGLAAYVTRLFLATDPEVADRELHALLERISRVPYTRRPNRAYPRVSYRPRLRWGPRGRVGA